jgi:hypothetical protein
MAQAIPNLSVGILEECGLAVLGTDDLRRHLFYDSDAETVQVFHFAGFLEENLNRACMLGDSRMLVYHPIKFTRLTEI